MKLIDLHSHWGTRKGYVLRTEAELARQKHTWNSEPKYHSEEEMAAYFRSQNVRAILDFGFTKKMPVAEAREHHDYGIETVRKYPDAVLGLWLQIDPNAGAEGAKEFERVIQACPGFVGIGVSGSGAGYPCTDPVFDPFYEVRIAHTRPALVIVGTPTARLSTGV